jgi:hypothetical protein
MHTRIKIVTQPKLGKEEKLYIYIYTKTNLKENLEATLMGVYAVDQRTNRWGLRERERGGGGWWCS